jgi:hypothetical protein
MSRDFAFGVLALIAAATASIVGQLATYPNLVPCGPAQTIIQSFQLRVCPILDGALFADGICRLAYPATA